MYFHSSSHWTLNFIGTLFGDGVYFASNSSFALDYCVDELGIIGISDRSVFQSVRGRSAALSKPLRSFQMYVVKVLVGDFTIGKKKMKEPPSKNDPNNPCLLFDSVVNKMAIPTIFVIFQDHQCYPEYLITFEHVWLLKTLMDYTRNSELAQTRTIAF